MARDFLKVFKGINFAGQASAPSSPANGDVYYDSSLDKLRVYQNGAWVNLSDSDGTVLLADGSATTPSLSFASAGNDNTGLFLKSADSLGFSANGTEIGSYSSSGAWTLGASGGAQNHIANGNLNIAAQGELRLQDTSGGEYVGHRATGTVTSSHTYTWPAALPSANRVLQSDSSGNLSWIVAGAGTVTGPGSSTNTAIARWDGTGGTALSNSGVLIDASNNISGINNLSLSGYGDFAQIATPSNPSASRNRLYFKTDGNLYQLNSAGSESRVGSGDISNGGNSFGSAITIGTNDAFALNFETNSVVKASVTSAGAWTLGESAGTQTHAVNGNLNITGLVGVVGTPSVSLMQAGSSSNQTLLSGTTQEGLRAVIRSNSSATARTLGFVAEYRTEATAYTTGVGAGIRVLTPTIGATSIVTRNIGLLFQDVGTGGTNNAFISDNETFTGNWFINSTSTNASLISGSVTLGASAGTAVHQLNGGVRHTVRSISANTTLDTTTTDYIVLASSSSGAITITLPTATSGRKLVIKDSGGAAATNNITVQRAGGALIDGLTTIILDENYQAVTLVSDGTNWWVC